VRFVLDVELEGGNFADELGDIFRYWAGRVHNYSLSSGLSVDVYDSAHNRVGHWHVSDVPHELDEGDYTAASVAADEEDGDEEDEEYEYGQNDPNSSYAPGYDYPTESYGQY
jgi:hypothetical protein